MTANPLKMTETTPRPGKRTAQEWCDEGNARLAGLIPYTCKKYAGEFHVRDDVYWFVENGRPTIGWRR
jgi:hypothetical protein